MDPARLGESRADLEKRFTHVFTPLRTATAALSPDGRYIAYSVRDGEELSVQVIEIDHPEVMASKVTVATDSTSTAALDISAGERTPARIRWMRWATPTRLVVETNTNFAQQQRGGWSNVAGAILAFDANGTNDRVLITPRRVAELDTEPFAPEPTDPDADTESDDPSQITNPEGLSTPAFQLSAPHAIDFSADNPEELLVGTVVGTTYRVYGVNVMTGKLRYLQHHIWEEGMAALPDRTGRPRAGLRNWSRAPFPHRYVWESGRLLGRPIALDEILGIPKGEPGFTVSPDNFLGERAFPIGFDEDPSILYYASNLGRDTFGIYGINLETRTKTGLVIENPGIDLVAPATEGFLPDNVMVFDRFERKLVGFRTPSSVLNTVWLRPELRAAQPVLQEALEGKSVTILEWSQDFQRFLVLAESPTDPGAYYIFDRPSGRISEFADRAPWMRSGRIPFTVPFTIESTTDQVVHGFVALPRRARTTQIPVVLMFGTNPWDQAATSYQGQIEALAEMGFAVIRVDARGSWGFGRAHRDVAEKDIAALQAEDALAAIDSLSKRFPLNTKRIALLGSARGAYVALRAMQLHPERFKCAVSLDGTLSPISWMEETRWAQRSTGPALMRRAFGSADVLKLDNVVRHPEEIKGAVMLLAYRGPVDRTQPRGDYVRARNLAASLRSDGVKVEFHDLREDFVQGRPRAYSEVFARIEKFINESLYDYEAKLGDFEVIE